MKKKLSFLMALVAMWLYTGSVWAQETIIESPWTGMAIENGNAYYLYNIKAQAFLKGANSWGTRASFGEDAIAFIAEGEGNVYALSSTLSYAGKYLGENLFVDSPKADYVFDEVADGIYTFNLNGAYYAYTGLNTVETVTEVTDGCYWQLLTADAIKEQMAIANVANPYIVTTLISGANFNRNNQANSVWIGSPATGGDNPNYCAEKWGAGAFDVNQTLTGLPNGTYLLQAQGFYRVGGGANDATLAVEQYAAGDPALNAILYGNDAEMPLMSIMAEAKAGNAPNGNYFSTSLGYVPQNMTGASLFFSEGLYEHAMYVTVTDGTLKIGVKKSVELANDWVIFDNFRLTYYGNASVGEIEASKLQDYIDEVVALIAAAQEVETIYSEGAKTELDVAVAVGEAAIAAPTKEGLVAAVAPLEAAIARAERSVAINVVAGSATLTAPVTFTQFVTNPDMANGTVNGWTTTLGWQFQSNMVYTGEGAELNKFQERWAGGTGLGNTSTMQALKDMPNGIYRVSADVMATAQYDADPEGYTTGAYWVANKDSVAVATANEKPERVSVDVMVTDGVLNIGLVGVNTTANWMGLDNVTVVYYGAEGSLEDIDKQEYIDAFNVQCVELASLADTYSTIHLIPAVSERFFAVQEPAFAIYESVSVAPVDTLIYYTVLLQETTAYVKAMDAKYNEWKTVLLSCYDAQDSITTASPEATAAFAKVVDRHAAYQWSMPAATTAEMDTLIAELNDAQKAFLIAAETPSSEDTSVAIDKTDKVGTSKEAWNTTGGSVTIDGISMPEVYETTTATLGDVMWQTVEGLDNGVYTVELWANARYTPERGFESAATDGQLECTYLFANNVEISIPVVYNRNLTNNVSYVLDGVEVTDGTLTMGMTKKADGSNWHTIQIKSLTLHTSGEAALAAAQAKLQTVLDTAVTVPATEALTAAITAAQTVLDTSTDIDELNAAVVTLKTAIAIAVNTNAVAGATVGSPIVTNFVVNGTFDTDGVVAPWKTTTGAVNQTTATNQTGAFTGNFFENWNGSNFTGKIYQVIENIPNGLYELSICAFVATLGDSAQYVYANADRTVLTTGEPTAYTVRTTVTNNTLEIGLEQAAAVNGWMGIDNVSLTYFGEEGGNDAVDDFISAYTSLVLLTENTPNMWMIPAVNERFFAVQEPAFAIYESVGETPVDTLIYYTVLIEETTEYVKAMDAKYNEWKTVLFSCYDTQDNTTTASPEATAAFAEVVDKHAAYQWSMPAATTAEMDILITELSDVLTAFLKAATPENAVGHLKKGDIFTYTQADGVEKTYKVVGSNLITNHSFDNGVEGWTGGAGGALENVEVNYSGGVDGGSYIRPLSNMGKGSNYSIGTAWEIEKGKTYVFSYFIRQNSSVEAIAKEGYIVTSETNTPRGDETKTIMCAHVDADCAWTQNIVVTTAEYNHLQFCARWLGGSKCFDDFVLAEVAEIPAPNLNDNSMYAQDVVTSSASIVTIPVELENADAITAFQFDMVLPVGVSPVYMVEDGEMIYDIAFNSDRARRGHVVSAAQLADGTLRVGAFSVSNELFIGNSGVIVNVAVQVDSISEGDYPILLRNIRMVKEDATEELGADHISILTVKDGLMGDVNSDRQHTMSDVVMMVNAVLEKVQANFDYSVADMNGDGIITMGDVVSVLRLVLGYEPVAAVRSISREMSSVAMEAYSAVAGGNGEFVLPVYMNSEAAYTAFQVDVVLPEDMTLVAATLGARAKSSHSIAWSTLDNGAVRIVAFATDNATFKNTAESLLYLTLKSDAVVADDAVVALTNGLFATVNGTEDRACDVAWRAEDETTGIGALLGSFSISGAEGAVVVESVVDATISIYTMTGQLVQQAELKAGWNRIALPAGVYVINNKKVIVK